MSYTRTVFTNPFVDPIKHNIDNMHAIDFGLPWLPQIIQYIVLTSLIILFCVLYITVGIISQIEFSLTELIQLTKARIRPDAAIENSAYVVSIGIFSLLKFPFWLFQLPFRLIGWAWGKSSFLGIFIIILVLAFVFFTPYPNYWSQVVDWLNSINTYGK